MQRYKRKTDNNHVEITQAFRNNGFTVVDLSAVGSGVPDLLVSRNNKTYLVEVKSPTGKLNDLQIDFRKQWQGKIFIVRYVDDIFYLSGNLP